MSGQLRFSVSKFDATTYQVVDNDLQEEVCVCSDYSGQTYAAIDRARMIAATLSQLEKSGAVMLTSIAEQLKQWATESRNGGWSTHQVDPMLDLAAKIHNQIGE